MFKLLFSLVLVAKTLGSAKAQQEDQLFPKLPSIIDNTENGVCKAHSETYKNHLQNLTLWAYEMLDSSSKDTYSILQGGETHFGNWEECVNINGPFKTQYCLVTLTANVSVNSNRDPILLHYGPFESVLEKFRISEDVSKRSRNFVKLGVCLPASCSPRDITHSYNLYLKNVENSLTKMNVSYKVDVDKQMCQTRDSGKQMDGYDILFCILCAGLVLAVMVSTLFDLTRTPTTDDIEKQTYKHKSTMETIYLAFSARANTAELFKKSNSKAEFKIFHGIKALSLLVVIFGHKMMLASVAPTINFDYIEKSVRSPFIALSLNSGLFVDTFFTISGLLLSYSWLSKNDTKINAFSTILLRIIRLTPMYAFMVFFGATIFYYTGSGPLWNSLAAVESQDCRINWWKNLLFISNYVDSENVCMAVTWYIASDLHLFILGVFIMVVLSKSKRLGYLLITILLVLSLIIPFAQILYYQIPPIIQYFPGILEELKRNEFFNLIYIKSHNRAIVYLMGLVSGIVYCNLKNKTKSLSKFKFYSIICGALLIIFVCLLSGAAFYNRRWKIDHIISAMYFPLVQVLWSAATITIFFSVVFNHDNVIKSMLSSRVFLPISKLAYGIYLVHFPMQFIFLSKSGTLLHISLIEIIYGFISDSVLTIAVAFVLYICVEAPIKHVCNALIRRSSKK